MLFSAVIHGGNPNFLIDVRFELDDDTVHYSAVLRAKKKKRKSQTILEASLSGLRNAFGLCA